MRTGWGPKVAIGLIAAWGSALGCRRSDSPATSSIAETPPPETGAPLLTDVTRAVGLDRIRHDPAPSGEYWIPEINSSGAAWMDIDNDGDLDAYLIQCGQWDRKAPNAKPNQLFRNDGGVFTDITAASGAGNTGYGWGSASEASTTTAITISMSPMSDPARCTGTGATAPSWKRPSNRAWP